MLPRNPLTPAARSELPGRSGAHLSQAVPSVQAACISSRLPASPHRVLCRVSHGICRGGLCPPHTLMLSPFPGGGFIPSTTRPLCLCGSAAFAKSLVPEACEIPRSVTASLAARSHHPRFLKLEGPARRHLPTWQGHLGPSDTFLGRFLEVPDAGDSSQFQHRLTLPFLLGFFYI